MGGVGSFMRQNRTIYVGRIHVTDDIEEIVARHFAEWGQIERSESLPMRYFDVYIITVYSSCAQYPRSRIHYVFERGERAICKGGNGASGT